MGGIIYFRSSTKAASKYAKGGEISRSNTHTLRLRNKEIRSARSAGVRPGQGEDQMSISPAELCKHHISTTFHHQLIQLMDPTARGLFSLLTMCVSVREAEIKTGKWEHTLWFRMI